jgi:DNA-directed RNA polymerase subunit A"
MLVEVLEDGRLRIHGESKSFHELSKLEKDVSDKNVKGIEGISRVLARRDRGEYVLYTVGSELKRLKNQKIEGVDFKRTKTNNIAEIAEVLGIEAARNAIIDEMMSTLKEQGLEVDARHITLIADAMTMDGEVKQIGRHGIAGEKVSVLSRAAFEVTVDNLLEAAIHGETDELRGVTENVIVGQPIKLGTGAVELVAGK